MTAALERAPGTDDASLHVGVRQAGDGEQVPVTVTSSTDGTVWELELQLAGGDVALGNLAIGADGTGTSLVTIPVGTPSGVAEITAASGGSELTASVSVAGTAGAAPAGAAEPASPIAPVALGGAIVVLAAVVLTLAVVLLLRRHRGGGSASA